ncbi:MAG: 3-isopropylmalate dehydratase small subunit [Bacillota bacterium]
MIAGRAWKFGDDISTDLIAPGRYFHLRSNMEEFAKHVFEDANPDFATEVKAGDFVVAGKNFGLGSSREHAPLLIKMAGVSAIIAKSVARIFFRNAINLGLPVLICDTDSIEEGAQLEADLVKGILRVIPDGQPITFTALPDVMLKILNDGGLIDHMKKHKGFALSD